MDHLLETSFLKIKTLLLHVCSGVRVRVLIRKFLVGGSLMENTLCTAIKPNL